jgi:phage/plasmid-like protein (TIGR03299 family)
MAHYYDAGFAVRQPSWHGLEELLLDYPADLTEALPLAFPRRDGKPGHWEPTTMPVYLKREGLDEQGNLTAEYVEVTGKQAIVRDDDLTPLGLVGGEYGIIDNRTVMEIAEAMVQAGGDERVKIDVAGSVKDGAEVFVTITLDEPAEVGGDDTPTYPFFVVTSGHDGSTACRAGYGFIRVVCANTVLAQNMAWDQGTAPSYTFRHTSGVTDRIDEAKEAMAGLRSVWAQFQQISADLAAMPCDDEMMRNYLGLFIPMPEATDTITERQRNNILGERGTWLSLYEEAVTTEGHRGTALGLVDASVEYLDHYRRSRSQDTLVRRTLIKDDGLKARCFDLAREVCTA